MIIYHDGDGNVGHVIYVHPFDYDPAMNGEHFVRTDDVIAFERVHLSKDEGGAFQVSAKRDMEIEALDGPHRLGSELRIDNVPVGASIFINGVDQGVMDDSGVLEITPETTGFHQVRIGFFGYMDWERTFEVVG